MFLVDLDRRDRFLDTKHIILPGESKNCYQIARLTISDTHLKLDLLTFLADIEELIRQFFSRIPEHV